MQNLAYFEMSPHRAALIHLRGATRLESVLPQINPKIYPQQLKQVTSSLQSYRVTLDRLDCAFPHDPPTKLKQA